ncbi:hypothetical protein BJ508DRAFT_127222 [Ascobolus immersus RN42]|uniref:Uncharacterized protein n=1 Tax=Ascobolus immersus RN42 TaxID=1160509 RepID=A0A3N4I5G0_ASCIM|nr:hypothetical protein BJ508DRAFT_127222 [Ascobolus immersus RN42]
MLPRWRRGRRGWSRRHRHSRMALGPIDRGVIPSKDLNLASCERTPRAFNHGARKRRLSSLKMRWQGIIWEEKVSGLKMLWDWRTGGGLDDSGGIWCVDYRDVLLVDLRILLLLLWILLVLLLLLLVWLLILLVLLLMLILLSGWWWRWWRWWRWRWSRSNAPSVLRHQPGIHHELLIGGATIRDVWRGMTVSTDIRSGVRLLGCLN